MTSQIQLSVDPADHVLGPADAAVTVVEYADFECPNCKQAMPAVKILLARFDGRVRFVFRHYPLEGEHPRAHPHALQAAVAAETAGAQGMFWPMHDRLFAERRKLRLPQLRRHARQLRLDLSRYDAELAEARYLRRVREHIESGRRIDVRGTPAFFVNGAYQDVSFGMRHLLQGVEAALRPLGQ